MNMCVVISYGFLFGVSFDNNYMLLDVIEHSLVLHKLISIEPRIKCPHTSTSSADVSYRANDLIKLFKIQLNRNLDVLLPNMRMHALQWRKIVLHAVGGFYFLIQPKDFGNEETHPHLRFVSVCVFYAYAHIKYFGLAAN